MQQKAKQTKLLKIFTGVVATITAAALVGLLSIGAFVVQADTTDPTPPSDVENLTATAGDGQVLLKWDEATDNVTVVGYKIFRGTQPVKNESGTYNMPPITVQKVTSHTISNLVNGQTYYFSIIALDAQSNESLNYATEVSAKPEAGTHLSSVEDDGKAPQLEEVRSEDIITVVVGFSEAVKLPEEQPASAFVIEEATAKNRLEVQKAEIDTRDSEGKTVLLTTAPQNKGVKYVITAGIELKDYFGNPLISGTSDTGQFTGSDKQRPATKSATASTTPPTVDPKAETEDTNVSTSNNQAPRVVSGAADFDDRISVTFSEQIQLGENPTKNVIVRKKTNQRELEVKNVTLSLDGKIMYITTDKQEATDYEVRISKIKDMDGTAIEAGADVVTVSGKGSGLADLIPPEDVTKLVARVKNAQRSIVELKWVGSENTAGDLADQMLYQGDGKKSLTFGAGAALGTSTTAVDVENLQPGSWYTFKISTKDYADNESAGLTTSIYLPETGPGMIAGAITAVVMGLYHRRRRRGAP